MAASLSGSADPALPLRPVRMATRPCFPSSNSMSLVLGGVLTTGSSRVTKRRWSMVTSRSPKLQPMSILLAVVICRVRGPLGWKRNAEMGTTISCQPPTISASAFPRGGTRVSQPSLSGSKSQRCMAACGSALWTRSHSLMATALGGTVTGCWRFDQWGGASV